MEMLNKRWAGGCNADRESCGVGGKAGRKRAAGNREEEEAVQRRKAEARGPGGWTENKLSF